MCMLKERSQVADTHLSIIPMKSPYWPCSPGRRCCQTHPVSDEICFVYHLKDQWHRNPRRGRIKNLSPSCRLTIKLSVLGNATAVLHNPWSCFALNCPVNLSPQSNSCCLSTFVNLVLSVTNKLRKFKRYFEQHTELWRIAKLPLGLNCWAFCTSSLTSISSVTAGLFHQPAVENLMTSDTESKIFYVRVPFSRKK